VRPYPPTSARHGALAITSDGLGVLYVSETPASTSSVLRYRIATGAEDVAIGNAVLADGRSVALQFATALGLDPAGNLYVGDDPTEGEQALQEHVWTAAVGTPFPAPRPVVDLAPSAGLAFGTVTVGQSVSQNATLANTGDAPLTIGGIAVSGAGAADFAIDGTACRSSLPAGSSCTIAVAFSPTAAGPQGAELVVTDDRGGSVPRTQRLARSGTGVARATKPTSAPTPASTASTSPSSTASSTASATKAASTRCSSSAPREPWRSAHPSGTR
jgi:hypothetical protein